MLCIKRLFVASFCILVCALSIMAQTKVPDKDRFIFLWDVSGSLLTDPTDERAPKIDIFTNESIMAKNPGYGNGLWMDLKNALITSIECLDVDSRDEIIVIPFYARPLNTFHEKADYKGKKAIIEQIKQYKYPRGYELRTDIEKALETFEEIVRNNCDEYVNYMFLYTDGGHENVKDRPDRGQMVVNKIEEFTGEATAKGRYIYRFNVLVDATKADPDNIIRDWAESHPKAKFWVVDSLVRIKFVCLDLESEDIEYNINDNLQEGEKRDTIKIIPFTKDFKDFRGNIKFVAESENKYYDVKCCVKGSNLEVRVTSKPNISFDSLPNREVIKVVGKLEGAEWFYPINFEFNVHCINTPPRCLSLSIKNQKGEVSKENEPIDLGKTEYYKSFYTSPEKFSDIEFSLSTHFNDYAKNDKSLLHISFVDKEGNPLCYNDFKIVVNGQDTLSQNSKYVIDYKCTGIDFQIIPSSSASGFSCAGRVLVSDVDELDKVNGALLPDEGIKILDWKFKHERKCNPLIIFIIRIVVLTLLLFVLAIIWYLLKWKFGPKFHENWDIKFASSVNFNPTITFDCPEGKDYRFKRERIFTHNGSIFFSRRLHKYRINKVVLCNHTSVRWSYFNGYSIYIKTNINNNSTIKQIKGITFTPSITEGILAKVKIEYADNTIKEELSLCNSNDETNRILLKYIGVEIFGKKHNN